MKKFLALFGIMVTPDKKHPVHLSGLFFVLIGVVVVCLIAGSVGMYSYSTNPTFCNSCHIMEPYYKAWETSAHKGKATCVDCHYPPATSLTEHLWHKFQASSQVIKYITRTYSSKPFAEIEDGSCLRSGCHSKRLLEGRLVTKKRIKFDHRPHFSDSRPGRQLRCVSCHSQIVVEKHVEVTYSSCYLCHFRGEGPIGDRAPLGGCLGCHDIPQKDIQIGNMTYNHLDFVKKRGVSCRNCHLDAIHGEGKADQERCFSCHNQPEKLAQYDNLPLIHENHVTKHNIACLHCHEEIQHGKDSAMANTLPRLGEPGTGDEKKNEVSEDHGARTVTADCAFCHEKNHTGQLMMYTGNASSLELPDMPSPMFAAGVDCIGCHFGDDSQKAGAEFIGKSAHPVSSACEKCHGPEYAGMWSAVKNELQTTLSGLDQKIEAVQGALAVTTLTGKEKEQAASDLEKVKRWQAFVKLGHGEHNFYLAAATLRKEDSLLSEIGQKIQIPLSDLSQLPIMTGSYCTGTCHPAVNVQIPKETVQSFGKEMPHKMHADMMPCVTCHELGPHKQGPLKEGLRETLCASCHAAP